MVGKATCLHKCALSEGSYMMGCNIEKVTRGGRVCFNRWDGNRCFLPSLHRLALPYYWLHSISYSIHILHSTRSILPNVPSDSFTFQSKATANGDIFSSSASYGFIIACATSFVKIWRISVNAISAFKHFAAKPLVVMKAHSCTRKQWSTSTLTIRTMKKQEVRGAWYRSFITLSVPRPFGLLQLHRYSRILLIFYTSSPNNPRSRFSTSSVFQWLHPYSCFLLYHFPSQSPNISSCHPYSPHSRCVMSIHPLCSSTNSRTCINASRITKTPIMARCKRSTKTPTHSRVFSSTQMPDPESPRTRGLYWPWSLDWVMTWRFSFCQTDGNATPHERQSLPRFTRAFERTWRISHTRHKILTCTSKSVSNCRHHQQNSSQMNEKQKNQGPNPDLNRGPPAI